MRNLLACLAAIALAAGASWSATTIVGWDFEQNMGQWQSPDPLTKLTLAVGPNEAASGSAALYARYPRVERPEEMQQRQMPGAIMVQLPGAPAPAPTCLEFAIRSKLAMPLMVMINCSDGVNYTRGLMVQPGAYSHVKLFLDEFQPDENARPPYHALHGGSIQGIGFVDASSFLVAFGAQVAQAGPIRLPRPQMGENEVWLDDIKLTDEPPPAQAPPLVDATSNVPKFVAIMNADGKLAREPAGLSGKPCWVMSYHLSQKEVAALSGGAPFGAMANSAGLHVVLSATVPTTLLCQVKELNNAEYNTVITLQPGKVVDRVIPWAEFRLGKDQKDPDGMLDIGQIKEASLLDVSETLPGAQPHSNELRIGAIEAMR